MNYEAPTISGQHDLQGALIEIGSPNGRSDATIKHGVAPVAYEAPAISGQREIDGRMQVWSLDEGR